LNPKKLFDAPPMDSNLRYGENYHVKVWNSALHFEHEHGLAGAIEMCNGQGVCRKSNGVMCPSFQASGEEGLSTRGRANLLRELIRGRKTVDDGRSAVYGLRSELEEATFKSLDLCLACKGCTSECPSGVDMPKLKYEFMNQYYKLHRRPLHDFLFAYFHVVAKWLSPIAPLVNFFIKMKWSKKLISKTFGIAGQRQLPLFRRSRFQRDKEVFEPQRHGDTEKKIVLFLTDVFSEYIEPEVKESAIEILNHLGYEVKELSLIGAGASFLSKGFIDQAKHHAEKVLDEIKSFGTESNIPVVGCEPPEVYCLKDEYVALLPHRKAEIESITKNVFMVDEFILRVAKLGELNNFDKQTNKEKIFFHPHCHHRASSSGTSATVDLLHLLGYEVELSDAGCCGMAGTFGFDAEHYDLSMQIGELKLLPRVRELGIRNWKLVSSGAACRMQIQHGAGVEAKHPLVIIRDVLLKK
jgi:Fe-S oxidoreductase